MKKIISLTMLIYSVSSFSQPSVGKVVEVNDKVIAQQGAKQRVLTSGSPIYKGEAIITGDKANTKIEYTNGTSIVIHKNSDYKTVNYTSQTELKGKLNKGAIEYASTGKKKAVIQTPVVALAIQGTRFKLISTQSKIFLQVTEGLVKGGNQMVGPSQQFSSGSFDKNQKFTAGPIPWNSFTSGEASADTSSSQNSASATNSNVTNSLLFTSVITTSTASELSSVIAQNSLVTMPPISTELIEIGVQCGP